MANDNDLTITLSLDDKASKPANDALKQIGDNANKATLQASKAFEDMGRSLQSVGREIGHVSTTLAFLGGGIVAPFALALNNASKSSVQVSEELSRLSNVTQQFQITIAEAVLPVTKQFTNQMIDLTNTLNSIPKPMRDAALQTVFLTGEVLIAVAAVGLLSKEIIILIANIELLSGKFLAWIAIPANAWLLGVAAAVAVLAALIWNCQSVADVFFNTMEIGFRLIWTLALNLDAAIRTLFASLTSGLATITDALAKIPGPTQKAFEGISAWLKEASKQSADLAQKDLAGIGTQMQKVGDIAKTGQGDWAQTFQKMKASIEDMFGAHKAGTDRMVLDTQNAQKELVTLSNQLRDLNVANTNKQYLNEKMQLNDSINMAKFYQQNWMQAHATVTNFALTAAKSVSTNLTSAITDLITGAKTAAQAFADLGKAMIQMVVQYFVQKAVSMALDFAFGKSMLAASVAAQIAAGAAIAAAFAPAALAASIATFGGAALAAAAAFPIAAGAEIAAMASTTAGGAHLSDGTDTVPAMLTPGEMVVPQSMADAIRKGQLSLGGPQGGNGGGDVNIYMSGVTINSKDSVRQLAEELGFEIERRSRNARSNI